MSARTSFYLPQQSSKQRVNATPWTVEAVAANEEIDPFEFARTIAVARVTMPRAMVRLSAGREQMDDSLQALCFLAGANSLFYGDKLLVTSNPLADRDRRLLQRLGIATQQASQLAACPTLRRRHVRESRPV